jgi:hypothetical protein
MLLLASLRGTCRHLQWAYLVVQPSSEAHVPLTDMHHHYCGISYWLLLLLLLLIACKITSSTASAPCAQDSSV